MNKFSMSCIGLVLGALSVSCFAQVYDGYPDIPAIGLGFVTEVISYEPGVGVKAPQNDSSRAPGEPNLKTTSLGRSGTLVLSTGDLKFVGDGTDASDFYIYEHMLVGSNR